MWPPPLLCGQIVLRTLESAEQQGNLDTRHSVGSRATIQLGDAELALTSRDSLQRLSSKCDWLLNTNIDGRGRPGSPAARFIDRPLRAFKSF